MKKKIKWLAAAFLLLATLSACGQKSDMEQKSETEQKSDVEQKSETEQKSDTEQNTDEDSGMAEIGTVVSDPSNTGETYEKLVERFYTLVADPYCFEDIAENGESGVIESAKTMGDNALDGMGYTIEDLSGDGIPELVVGTLPEYGRQINAVYTLVDGRPQLVFEGWYRSSYSYLGDGRFYYYGSGGAAETGQGFFRLSKDGTTLDCEDFYFTHATEEDYSDLKVYYNTTGSWDIAESQKADMSLEMFWAYEPSYKELPLISFADYAVE